MASAFTIKRNDTRPVLTLTLTENGSAKDLTGAVSCKLLMKSGNNTASRTASITNAASGIIQVTLQAADTATAGTYQAEVEITWAAGAIETVPNDGYFVILVMEDLG